MPSLILSGDTISVRLQSQRLEVIRWVEVGTTRESRMSVPIADIDRVVVIGHPNLTIPVLQRLMFDGIPTYFLTSRGRWIGTLTPDNNKNSARRIRQYQMNADHGFSLKVARALVQAKIKNSRRVLQRLSANRQESSLDAQQQADQKLAVLVDETAGVESMESLRGMEGLAAARYFERLADFFPSHVPFRGRSRRPPRDPANALLSWTYTILLGEVEGAVRAHGLDAGIGFLHEISYGTPCLPLDLMEPLRAPVCDLLVLNILNHRILTDEDFEYHAMEGGYYLKENAHRTFFQSYESAMIRKFTPVKGESHTDFRAVIQEGVMTILRGMDGGEPEPEFFLMP